MTELGEPAYLLGVEIRRDRSAGTLSLNQAKYIDNMLGKYNMKDAHPNITPLTTGIKLKRPDDNETLMKAEKAELAAIPYSQVIGALIYLTCLTCPDLAFPVHFVFQFMASYRADHWGQVKKILRYVKSTQHYNITYSRSHPSKSLQEYTDSDWGADPVTRKSVGAYLFMLADAPVTWACKKNQSVCLSSTESEYKAMTSAAKEVVWCRRCLSYLGQAQKQPIVIPFDNSGAIALCNNPIFYVRTKHIAVHHHFIRDVVAQGETVVQYVKTTKNLANALTKRLPSETLKRHCTAMGLCSEAKVNKPKHG